MKDIPVVAIGGINYDNCGLSNRIPGVDGIAVVSAIFAADDPVTEAAKEALL